MDSKSDKIKVMINDKADEFIEELFQQLLSWNQIELEISIISNYSICGCVHLLYYKYHKISFKQGGSYIDSLDWIKNSIKKKEKRYSQYFTTVALNHEKNKKRPAKNYEMPFIIIYNWKTINNSTEKKPGKKMRKINQQLLLTFFAKKEKIYPAYA